MDRGARLVMFEAIAFECALQFLLESGCVERGGTKGRRRSELGWRILALRPLGDSLEEGFWTWLAGGWRTGWFPIGLCLAFRRCGTVD